MKLSSHFRLKTIKEKLIMGFGLVLMMMAVMTFVNYNIIKESERELALVEKLLQETETEATMVEGARHKITAELEAIKALNLN